MKISTLLGAALMAAGVQSANCTPTYKNPNATVDARVADLLSRMTNQEKAAKLIQGTSTSFTNLTTGAINETGLEWTLTERSHSVWVGLNTTPLIQKRAAELAQGWLKNNTELGKNLSLQAVSPPRHVHMLIHYSRHPDVCPE